MTDMEKKVMVRLCAKILSETDLYDMDTEVRNLIDWICVSEQIKSNNNEIRSLTGEYKRIEPDCREGVRAQLMQYSEAEFREIANNIIIPVSKVDNHPLGGNLLDEFLRSFDKPAQRDIWWSIPTYLRNNYNAKFK